MKMKLSKKQSTGLLLAAGILGAVLAGLGIFMLTKPTETLLPLPKKLKSEAAQKRAGLIAASAGAGLLVLAAGVMLYPRMK